MKNCIKSLCGIPLILSASALKPIINFGLMFIAFVLITVEVRNTPEVKLT